LYRPNFSEYAISLWSCFTMSWLWSNQNFEI